MQGAAEFLRQSKKVIGIGFSARQRGKQLCVGQPAGEENFYTGIAHGEQVTSAMVLKVLREGGIYTPALREI